MHYSYQAVDSVTKDVYIWTSETPDPSGSGYPGPNAATNILQTNTPVEDLVGACSPGGYGLVDPPNLVANGDFCRWTGADGTSSNIAGWYGSTNGYGYEGTKCGVGCTDTDRTLHAPNCALLEPDGTDDRIAAHTQIAGPLDPNLLGCFVTVSLKYKIATGSANDLNLNCVAASNTIGAYQRGSQNLPMSTFAAESGWTTFTMCVLIDADMVASGIALQLWTMAASGVTLKVSEVQASIGYSAPRWFTRCTGRVGSSGTLREDGTLEFTVSTIPAGTDDPLFGDPWVDGDYARLAEPTSDTTEGGIGYTQLGWDRINGAWVPRYVLNALASTGNHLLDVSVEAQSGSDTTLSSDSATTVLTKSLGTLATSAHYVATIGFRATLWQTSDVTVCGTINETVDVSIATDGSGAASVTVLGTQDPDTTRLPTGLSGATAGLIAATGGFSVQVTRPAGLACTARARAWASRLERLS